MKLRKNNQITAPLDVGEIHTGDRVKPEQFYRTVSIELQRLRNENDDLRELLDDRESEFESLQHEVDYLNFAIQEYYRPVDPYTYNGVSRNDF